MARYDEAQVDYREFANIMAEIGKEIAGEERKLKEDIDRRQAVGDDSVQRRRDELMRAIDVSAMVHTPSQAEIKRTLYRLEVLSFSKSTVQHSPYPQKMSNNALGQILTQNP